MDRTDNIINSLDNAVKFLEEGDIEAAKLNILNAKKDVRDAHTSILLIMRDNLKEVDNNPDAWAFYKSLSNFLAGSEEQKK